MGFSALPLPLVIGAGDVRSAVGSGSVGFSCCFPSWFRLPSFCFLPLFPSIIWIFFAAVHPSLPSCVFPFSLVLFLLLRPLSALHSFSSLPYPVTLPVAPVTSFPSSSPVDCRFFFSTFKVFPLSFLSSVLACQRLLWLQLFLHLSLLPTPLSFLCWHLYSLWFLSLFFSFFSGFFCSSFVFCHSFCRFASSFLFGVSSSTFCGSSCVFSGFFHNSFTCCHPFCCLASSVSFALFCTYDSLFLGWRFVCSGLFFGIRRGGGYLKS